MFNGFHVSYELFCYDFHISMCFGQLGRSDLRHVTCAADLLEPESIASDCNLDIAVFDPRKRRYKAANGPKQGPIVASEGKSFIDLSDLFIFF